MVPSPLVIALALQLASAAAQQPAAGGEQPPPLVPHQLRPVPSLEEARGPGTTFALRWDNDVLSGTDRDYSNGASLTITRESRGLLGAIWGREAEARGRLVSGYEIGQLIMTPRDIQRVVPDPEDRPYSGILYAAVSTQYARGNRFDGLKLIAGVVGPASGAAETQKGVHRLTGSLMPQGWGSQLKNEAVVNAVYEHRRRYGLWQDGSGWGLEAIPVAGAMAGTVLTQAQAGAQFRFGWNLPDDFGRSQMRGLGTLPYPLPRRGAVSRAFGVYGFAGAGGTLVARNLSLDGNTFQDGPRVSKKPFFPGAHVGVAVWTRRIEASLTYVAWGREYETQAAPAHFATATIAYRF